ncbi:OPA3 domain protein [Talaromyces pinophilus]|uniref:OPA3 domain protein n=1 Tax=Talaromyces pinophilus TaxID=128442 RepID=A0A698XKA4_TALPI|nr:OPA3 domain protein [Talaromyces pinophilus]
MSLTLKLSSLVIRTLSKPIANSIKAQAREHERFRRLCVSMAQTIHRIDMRLKLGLLRDTAAIEERAAKEAAEAAARRHRSKVPTAKTEAEIQAEKAETEEAKKKAIEEVKAKPLPRIRPLSESKAIDSGANFISETFLFLVAGGLIVFESWRSRRKETSRRSDVQDRLVELEESEKAARRALGILEKELLELRAQQSKLPAKHMKRILPQEVWEEDTQEVAPKQEDQGWLAQIRSYFPSSSTTPAPSVQVAPPPPPATKKEESSLPSTTTDSPHSIIPTLLKPGHSSHSPKES